MFNFGIAKVEPRTNDEHVLVTLDNGDRVWFRLVSTRPEWWFVTLIMPPVGSYKIQGNYEYRRWR